MDLIIIKEKDGKLVVDGNSVYKFPCEIEYLGVYELKVVEIRLIPPAKSK